MKYTNYTVEDFVKDEYFQKWILDTDEMTSNYWNNWLLKFPEKKPILEEAKKLILLISFEKEQLVKEDFDAMWEHIIEKREVKLEETVSNKKGQRFLYWKYASAASIVLLISITLFTNLLSDFDESEAPALVNQSIEKGNNKAILTLSNGSSIALGKGEIYGSNNVISNEEEIVYTSGKTNKRLEYNFITIPKGGQFLVKLSDGTKVWLNSDSKLKYPVSFLEGETRSVELLYGEAYFVVSSSFKHNGSEFKVINRGQEVQVLGTEFNIKAYKDEANTYTTLVEGKVSVNFNSGKRIDLKPSQQSVLNTNNNVIVRTVNVFNEVSWKEGVFSFEDKSLGEVMKVLSRWYDVEILFENNQVAEELFFGILDKDQAMEEILLSIKNFGIINDYEIENKTIKLK